jgi:hypothetical protein
MVCSVGAGTIWVLSGTWFQTLGHEQEGLGTTVLKDLNQLGRYNIVIFKCVFFFGILSIVRVYWNRYI